MSVEKAGKKPKSLSLVLDSLDLVQGQMSVYGEKFWQKFIIFWKTYHQRVPTDWEKYLGNSKKSLEIAQICVLGAGTLLLGVDLGSSAYDFFLDYVVKKSPPGGAQW